MTIATRHRKPTVRIGAVVEGMAFPDDPSVTVQKVIGRVFMLRWDSEFERYTLRLRRLSDDTKWTTTDEHVELCQRVQTMPVGWEPKESR